MITRFFSTSKPIHLVIAVILGFLLFCIQRRDILFGKFELIEFFKTISLGFILVLSIIVLAFFVTKNNLTQANSYKILMYILFLAIMPATLFYDNVIIANFFIMLALRRIISLRTNLNVKKKLFDAAFWIGLASLFYFWSFLFFGLILAALLLYSIGNIKNWIIPFIGLLTVVILVVCYSLIVNDSFGNFNNYLDTIGYDFTKYNNIEFIVSATILISLGIWALFYYIRNLKDKPRVSRAAHNLVLFSAFIALVIIVVSSNKNGSEFIFLFAPLAVIMSNYLQSLKDKWFAEVFVWIMILTPVSILML